MNKMNILFSLSTILLSLVAYADEKVAERARARGRHSHYARHQGTHRGRWQRHTGRQWKTKWKTSEQAHDALKKQFIALQRQLNITTPAPAMKDITVSGSQATQQQFNKVRFVLNKLLANPILTPEDISLIKEKIYRLQELNPSRWPRAQDYKELLQAKISATHLGEKTHPSRPSSSSKQYPPRYHGGQ